jgi:hypothetical protein
MSKNYRSKESISKRLFNAVGALNEAVTRREDNGDRIERDYPVEKLRTDAYNTRKQRLTAVNQEFEKEWISALKYLDELCRNIRRRQPHLNELTSDNMNTGHTFPDAWRLAVCTLPIRTGKVMCHA